MAEKIDQLPSFLAALEKSSIVAELCQRLTGERHVAATGQWGSCALVLAAIVQKKLGRPMLIVTAHLDEADDAYDQLEFFRPAAATRLYPAFEVLPGESNLSLELASQRLELLAALAEGENSSGAATHAPDGAPAPSGAWHPAMSPSFIIAPIQALMQPSPNKELLATRAKQEAARHGMGDAVAYVEQVRRTSDVRKNPKAFE